jgi:hypothetical protein
MTVTGAPRRLVEACLAVLCAGSIYQLAVGLKLLDLGELPGEGPPLDELFFLAPLAVLLGGGVALVVIALAREQAAGLGRLLSFRALPVAAAAFPLCRAAAFDPYYLPALDRFRGVSLAWLVALAILGLVAAALSATRPGSMAVALTGIVLVASGVVAVGLVLH